MIISLLLFLNLMREDYLANLITYDQLNDIFLNFCKDKLSNGKTITEVSIGDMKGFFDVFPVTVSEIINPDDVDVEKFPLWELISQDINAEIIPKRVSLKENTISWEVEDFDFYEINFWLESEDEYYDYDEDDEDDEYDEDDIGIEDLGTYYFVDEDISEKYGNIINS